MAFSKDINSGHRYPQGRGLGRWSWALLALLFFAAVACSEEKSADSSGAHSTEAAARGQGQSPVGNWKIDVEEALSLAESSLRSHPSLAAYSGEQLEMTVAAMKDSLRPNWSSGRLTLEADGKYLASTSNRSEQRGTWKLDGRALVLKADPNSEPWILGAMSFEDGRIHVRTPDLKDLVIPYKRDS